MDFPMSTSNIQTKEFFHDYASDFNAIYSNRSNAMNTVVNTLFRKSMALRYDLTLKRCDPVRDRTVLDVGCGPGHYGIALARRGAAKVVGIDFAEGMIGLARQQAEKAGVASRCEFKTGDFDSFQPKERFDYVVVMGFMDYVSDPKPLVKKVLDLTERRALFSFPMRGGFLAWQRQVRYRSRCPLFLYTRPEIEGLFSNMNDVKVQIDPISRDFFVTVSRIL